MQMRPEKSFLFIFLVLISLLVLPAVFPADKIHIPGFEIRIFTLKQLALDAGWVTTPDTIIRITGPSPVPMMVSANQPEPQKSPTPNPVPAIKKTVELKKSPEPLTENAAQIEIPESGTSDWLRLQELMATASVENRPVRILYYGDSQIENDHITSVFRQKLQEKFGGAGRGLVPLTNIYNSANNFEMTVSSNWESTSVVKTKQTGLDLGLLCQAYRIRSQNESAEKSWVKIKELNNTDPHGYTEITVFYRAKGESKILLKRTGELSINESLKTDDNVNELKFALGTTPGEVELEFSTDSELTVYGLNLESNGGIMVDNIALRGRATPEFSRIDTSRLSQMAQLLKPAAIVLQYGVNVVPFITSNYSFYKKQLNTELAILRKIIPGVPILMVSVSDMAHKNNGLMESYPNLEAILKAQKETANENGCAFWNLFETMGGKGSMISWVENQPPLGNKDYVHYTQLGAEKVGSLFAGEFIRTLEPGLATAWMAYEP